MSRPELGRRLGLDQSEEQVWDMFSCEQDASWRRDTAEHTNGLEADFRHQRTTPMYVGACSQQVARHRE